MSLIASEICDELRAASGRLIRERGIEESVVGACAVHTGIQMLLRAFDPKDVALWLRGEADVLCEFAADAARPAAQPDGPQD